MASDHKVETLPKSQKCSRTVEQEGGNGTTPRSDSGATRVLWGFEGVFRGMLNHVLQNVLHGAAQQLGVAIYRDSCFGNWSGVGEPLPLPHGS